MDGTGRVMRHRRLVSVSVVGVVWLGLFVGVAGCTDDPSPRPSPSAKSTGFVEGSTAPDGGQVRLVESGFTAVSKDNQPSGMVTAGGILENTSKEWAASAVSVDVRFFDAAGGALRVMGSEFQTSYSVTILPGARMGVGIQKVAPRVFGDRRTTPARMELEVTVFGWWPASRVSGVVANYVGFKPNDFGGGWLSITVESQLPRTLDYPSSIIIVRDRNGKVIGGLKPVPMSTNAWPPGRSIQKVKIPEWSVPDDADMSRTEVFVGYAEVDR